MEKVVWQPPNLNFVIERHGATVLGSSRAKRHKWEVNINNRTAICSEAGYRQLEPRQRGVNVRPMAKEAKQIV